MRLTPELRLRCKSFGSHVIQLFKKLPCSRTEVRVLGLQLLRSGTSVGAHAREASRARSDAEFCSKLEALLQEADEAQLWLEYLEEECGVDAGITMPLRREADELLAIFVTIADRTRKRASTSTP